MRILIADDNKLVRRGIAGLLATDQEFEICGEAGTATDTLEKACQLRPDAILLDVSMPGGNGLETTRALREKVPESKILIISQHDPKQLLPGALKAGAEDCVDKARLFLDLLPAVRRLRQ